jgi:6-pyruvoyl-tetrahydropterin synthase
MYEVTVERVFAADHAIRLPDGTLEAMHPHDWRVRVTLSRPTLDAIETVIDFHEVQGWLERLLGPAAGRSLNDLPPFADDAGRLVISPTAERVAWWIGEDIRRRTPAGVTVERVAVLEAPGCEAAYALTKPAQT